MSSPLILMTNDDGYAAKGLRKLVALMRTIGEVVVVSTEAVMSSKSHSATLRDPLYVDLVEDDLGGPFPFREYRCNGTPVDGVKLGYQKLLPRRPDLVVSGINHGSNAGSTVVYSATVGAVVEACMDGMAAVAFSLDCFDADADFDHLDAFVVGIVQRVLSEGLPQGLCLNVNFPKRAEQPIQGLKVCRQATGCWKEFFVDRYDSQGRLYYNLEGEFVSNDVVEGTDLHAIEHNYASLVPTSYDWTAYRHIDHFKSYETIINTNENQR